MKTREQEIQNRLFSALKDEREDEAFECSLWEAEIAFDRGELERTDELLKLIGY